jgi:hypothetical protein
VAVAVGVWDGCVVVAVAAGLGVEVNAGVFVDGTLAGWHAAENIAKARMGKIVRVFMRSL